MTGDRPAAGPVQSLGDGIHVVDTGFKRPGFDAAYLVIEGGRAAFVDTGTNLAVPRLLAALAGLGLSADAVDYVIATHVHLDHAGGVGLLVQSLPHATVLVHPRGLPHLADPTQLYQGALAVYGQAEMDRSYGQLVAVAASRLQPTHDGQVIRLAGRPLLFADTPGHARHHHCVWDARSRGWFAGDTFGISYREFDTPAAGHLIQPAATPTQFDPAALKRSMARLLAQQPRCMYITHFGRVGDVPALWRQLDAQVDAMVALAEPLRCRPQRHAALKAALAAATRGQLQRHGVADVDASLALLDFDLELNAQGLAAWLDRSYP
jgi:glyoxylase-like metal-dependent hydrolase (beta-lactamase superfamily II)